MSEMRMAMMEAGNAITMVLATSNDTISSETSKTTQKSGASNCATSGDFKDGDDYIQTDDGKFIVVNNTIQALLFNVYHINCSMLHNNLIPVNWESLIFMRNRIFCLHGSHRNCKGTTFHQYVYDQCNGILTVTVNLLEVLEDFNGVNTIVGQPYANVVLILQEGIRETIIDYHHHHEGIREFCQSLNPEYNFTRESLPVILTLRLNGKALNDLYMT